MLESRETRSRCTVATFLGLVLGFVLVCVLASGLTFVAGLLLVPGAPVQAQTPEPPLADTPDAETTDTETADADTQDAETTESRTPVAELPAELQDLSAEIAAAYEVLPVRGGVVLQPTGSDADFRALEIADDGLALDGEPIDEEDLRDELGEAAEPILRLAALSAEQRSQVLGFPPPEVPDASAAPPQVPATPDSVEETVEAPERPRTRTGDKVSLAGGVTIEEDEVAQEVVVIAGPLRVHGEIEGGAVVVGGNAYIEGTVGRELMVVGGNAYLGPESVVEGDINIMAGGRVHQEPGAEVRGRINELGVIGPLFGDGDDDVDFDFRPRFSPFRWFSDVLGSLFGLVTLGLLACLVVLFGQRAVAGVEETLTSDPWRSGAAGLLFQILFVPLLVIVILLLAVSIIGIPLLLLVPFALLGLLLAGFVGFVGVALRLGRMASSRLGNPVTSPYLGVAIGIVLLDIWMVLAEALDLPFLGFFSVLSFVFGILVLYAAFTFGSGALLMRIGSRRRRRMGSHSGGLPPIPRDEAGDHSPDDNTGDDSLEETWDERRDRPSDEEDEGP